jgi:hypothetical protein
LLTTGEKIYISSRKNGCTITNMPTEIVLPEPEDLTKILACRWKELTINIKNNPINYSAITIWPSLCLPALTSTNPEGRQVIDHLTGPGYPTTYSTSNSI